MMNLQLVQILRENGIPEFQLDVMASLDAGGFASDGFVGPEADHTTGEKVLTLFAKEVANPDGVGSSVVSYQVPLGDTNPLPNNSDYLIVQLKGNDGTVLDSTRLDGGGDASHIPPKNTSRPF